MLQSIQMIEFMPPLWVTILNINSYNLISIEHFNLVRLNVFYICVITNFPLYKNFIIGI